MIDTFKEQHKCKKHGTYYKAFSKCPECVKERREKKGPTPLDKAVEEMRKKGLIPFKGKNEDSNNNS